MDHQQATDDGLSHPVSLCLGYGLTVQHSRTKMLLRSKRANSPPCAYEPMKGTILNHYQSISTRLLNRSWFSLNIWNPSGRPIHVNISRFHLIHKQLCLSFRVNPMPNTHQTLKSDKHRLPMDTLSMLYVDSEQESLPGSFPDMIGRSATHLHPSSYQHYELKTLLIALKTVLRSPRWVFMIYVIKIYKNQY